MKEDHRPLLFRVNAFEHARHAGERPAFGRFWLDDTGQSFVIFVITVAAAEAAMALALVVLLFRKRETLSADDWQELKG